jgi:hypothetical protein
MSSDRGTLEQAIAAGYLEAKNTKATEELRGAWREHREEHKLADIRVIPRRKTADVLVDLSPTGITTAAMPFRYPELRRLVQSIDEKPVAQLQVSTLPRRSQGVT